MDARTAPLPTPALNFGFSRGQLCLPRVCWTQVGRDTQGLPKLLLSGVLIPCPLSASHQDASYDL